MKRLGTFARNAHLFLSAPSAVSPVSGLHHRLAGLAGPLESCLSSPLPPKGRIHYACSTPDTSPQVIYSSTPLVLYLTYLFLQFKPITSFSPCGHTEQNCSSLAQSLCRLLCPTTAEMQNLSVLFLTITVLWIFSSRLYLSGSMRCNTKLFTTIEALPGSKIGKNNYYVFWQCFFFHIPRQQLHFL